MGIAQRRRMCVIKWYTLYVNVHFSSVVVTKYLPLSAQLYLSLRIELLSTAANDAQIRVGHGFTEDGRCGFFQLVSIFNLVESAARIIGKSLKISHTPSLVCVAIRHSCGHTCACSLYQSLTHARA